MISVGQEPDFKVTTFEDLTTLAQQVASKPYEPAPPLPEELANLSYDQYRKILFRLDKSIGRKKNSPFWLEMFHRGYVHADLVHLNLVSAGQQKYFPFSKNYFKYQDELKNLEIPKDLGFAGFRVAGFFPNRSDPQEIVTFLGSSYFRTRAATHVYGSSARGLAVNIGLPKDEEFPTFRAFWFFEPAPDDKKISVLALLDSPSVAGGYQFEISPGNEETVVDVKARLFFRTVPESMGIAPLTSMWLWGDGLERAKGDHRPEVHDADGLLIHSKSGEWTWRALAQQHYPSLMKFAIDGVAGFGLLQRDTNFSHYRDKEAKYHQRPSVWVEPKEPWQSGSIGLLELPAPHEGIDNIAVWWSPDQQIDPEQPMDLAYRIRFHSGNPKQHPLGKAVAHRIERRPDKTIVVEIDFDGLNVAGTLAAEMPTVSASSVRGEIRQAVCKRKSEEIWTAEIVMLPDGDGPVELRAVLENAGRPVTETFCYLCPLTPPPVALPPWRVKQISPSEEN